MNIRSIRRLARRALLPVLVLAAALPALSPAAQAAQTQAGGEAKTAAPAPAPAPALMRRDALEDITKRAARAERLIPDADRLLAAARQVIARPDVTIRTLGEQRSALDRLRLKILAGRKELAAPIRSVASQLKTLGPPPKEGGEDPAIAAQRKILKAAHARLLAVEKKLGLLALEARQLSEEAAAKQREIFLSRVFQPSRPALNPMLWVDGVATLPSFAFRLKVLLGKWSSGNEREGGLAFLVVLALFVVSLLLLIYVWRRWRRPLEEEIELDDFRRLWRALRVAIYSALVVVATLFLLNVAVYTLSDPSPRIRRFLDALTLAIMFSTVMAALARGVFRPATPRMRLVNVADAPARAAYRLAAGMAVFYALDYLMGRLADILFMPVAFSAAWSAFASVVYVVLAAMFISRVRQAEPLVKDDAAAKKRFFFGWTRYVFHLLWFALFVVVLALAIGYIALAHFITTRLVMTAAVISGLYLLHHLTETVVNNALDRRTYTGHLLRHTLSVSERTITQIGVLFSTLVDIAIVLAGLPAVLMLWAVNWVDMTNWARTAFFGFKIGNITIEPASILTGIVVLITGLILARLLTLWLERRVVQRTTLDSGVRHSIVAATRYTLIIAAVLVALSVAGVSFSSLAFIGGALGIGIGFGLQSIVNNFVSGLILLAERPIKVGDWIKVAGGEGVVRKIKVRSTEIETFDRCSVIIPNSSLISEPVSNWFHSSRIGREHIRVGVSYDADPEQVRRILLECAAAHPHVASFPEAQVLFTGFGDSSLDFDLRVYIDDYSRNVSVSSDLRFAIFRALKEAGIEIPFPQSDVHIRSLPEDAPLPAPERPRRTRKKES